MQKRMIGILAAVTAVSAALAARVYIIGSDENIVKASADRGQYHISDVCQYASVYDCKGERLNNLSFEYKAVVNPNSAEALKILPYVKDMDTYRSGMSGNLPFLCEVKSGVIDGAVVFRKYARTDENQPARHIVGYTSDGEGVCGIEYAYNDFLRSFYTLNEAEFSVNAVGGVLDGLYSEVSCGEELNAGVVTSLDKDIQLICEKAMKKYNCQKGAVVVMEVKSGEIRACASYPEFNPAAPAESLDSADAPFVNRAFSAYSVGSIFKLVTAASALELGISPDFSYTCTGSINVNGQIFNCHKWGGHGEINMREAMEKSCNPYFIALSEYIDSESFLRTAESFGFGKETVFGDGLVSAPGYLPDKRELSVRAEKANFSFGQGKLTAAPVQVCAMTAAIADKGMYSGPKLILGTVDPEGTYEKLTYSADERVMSYRTARLLGEFMEDVVNAENSMSRSYRVSGAGKTSTAQTGRFNDDGSEQFNCWFTGYFPAEKPEYAVTILIEGGVSGNVTCAPVYKEIAENIISYEKQKS